VGAAGAGPLVQRVPNRVVLPVPWVVSAKSAAGRRAQARRLSRFAPEHRCPTRVLLAWPPPGRDEHRAAWLGPESRRGGAGLTAIAERHGHRCGARHGRRWGLGVFTGRARSGWGMGREPYRESRSRRRVDEVSTRDVSCNGPAPARRVFGTTRRMDGPGTHKCALVRGRGRDPSELRGWGVVGPPSLGSSIGRVKSGDKSPGYGRCPRVYRRRRPRPR